MYVVVSKWRMESGGDDLSQGAGSAMREWLRGQDGVDHVHAIRTEDGAALVIVGYRDEATHKRLIEGDGSPFERKAKETGLDSFGEWVWSERGETVE